MFRHFITVILVCASYTAFSQDTIVLFNGDVIIGKVLEISSREIKYKTADNPDGPVYIKKHSLVKRITYANGKQEIFDIIADRNELFMTEKMARHVVFAELHGSTVWGVSFNYDYTFFRKANYGFTVRSGINPAFAGNDETRYLVIPMMASFIYGNEAALELGAGAIVANYVEYHWDGSPWGYYKQVDVTQLIPAGIFGFRYQKKNAFFLKMAFTLFLLLKEIEYNNNLFHRYETKDQNFFFTLGLGAGIAF